MAIDKYKLVRGKFINISPHVYKAVENDLIQYELVISEEGKRLDHYANEYYGDANNWWIIAAASGIGWWLQNRMGFCEPTGAHLSLSEANHRRIHLGRGWSHS